MKLRQGFGKRFGKYRVLFATTTLFTGLVAASGAQAQSPPYLEAFQGIYAENQGPTGPFAFVTGNGSANSALNPFTGSASFSGLDSQGNPQTMSITGSAYSYADYGHVHAYGTGTITNPYYNAANPAYVNNDGSVNLNGSPDTLSVHGNAGWADTFTYMGLQGTGYKVDYYFQLVRKRLGGRRSGAEFQHQRSERAFLQSTHHGGFRALDHALLRCHLGSAVRCLRGFLRRDHQRCSAKTGRRRLQRDRGLFRYADSGGHPDH